MNPTVITLDTDLKIKVLMTGHEAGIKIDTLGSALRVDPATPVALYGVDSLGLLQGKRPAGVKTYLITEGPGPVAAVLRALGFEKSIDLASTTGPAELTEVLRAA